MTDIHPIQRRLLFHKCHTKLDAFILAPLTLTTLQLKPPLDMLEDGLRLVLDPAIGSLDAERTHNLVERRHGARNRGRGDEYSVAELGDPIGDCTINVTCAIGM